MRSILITCVVFLYSFSCTANNVRILGDVHWDTDNLVNSTVLQLKFTLAWDNSWRDDYNWDAVYICFKYKVAKPTDTYSWNHVYIQNDNNLYKVSDDYGYTISQATGRDGTAKNTGIFIYRKYNGAGNSTVEVVIPWDISTQSLSKDQFYGSQIQVSAVGIEMVYIPTGAFKLGDSFSEKTFRKTYTPIPEEYDVVSNDYAVFSSDGDSHPELAADRINDNEPTASSCWAPSTGSKCWWRIDFGEDQKNWKTIRFFGVNASKQNKAYLPSKWALYGRNTNSIDLSLPPLWSGGAKDWVVSDDAYPIEHAIKVETPQPYRYYFIYVESMTQGTPIVKSIGMTDQEVDKLLDYSVLVESPTLIVDSLKGVGARDQESWVTGETITNYPNGFLGYYAMKYEISQEQYVKFLNKLTRQQQEILLPQIKTLNKGSYVFGAPNEVNYRNGIIVGDKETSGNKPYTFADSLGIKKEEGMSLDGQTIACNYMSLADMLAYADWVGLRPLSEMEYEKMSRRPFPTIPLPQEYAWNTTKAEIPTGISEAGTSNEVAVGGNANFGDVEAIGGPIRVGAFAVNKKKQEAAGVSFYGVMDMSGNLAEMYYNANTAGRKFNVLSGSSHGDGYLSTGSYLTDIGSSIWPQGVNAIAIRGGSFKDSDKYLAVSDRSRNMNYLASPTERRPEVSFRLGYSLKETREAKLDVYLSLQNGMTSKDSQPADTICGYTTTYTIQGNNPDNVQGSYTFIWYMYEDGGKWRILEGENDQSLTYSKFVNNLTRLKNYQFKRLMVTPVAYAMTAPVTIVIDQVADAQLNTLVDTIDGFGVSQGGFYVSSSIPSEYTWRWVYRGRVQSLRPYETQSMSSHYVPEISQFIRPDGSISYGDNLVQMERNTKGLGSCFTTVDLTVFIKEEVPEVVKSSAVKCGNYMRDERDGQVYPTVLIGSQCWMGANLNYSKNGMGACYGSNSANCKIFGRMYTWYEANSYSLESTRKTGICPEGWHLPDNSEWNVLISKTSTNAGKKLKASKYWTFVSQNLVGTNSTGFNALPGGYSVPNNGGMNLYARWWTSNVGKWTHTYQYGGHYEYKCGSRPGSGHTGGEWRYGRRPSYCGGEQRYVYYTGTNYNYDGYFVQLVYNSNSMSSPSLLRVDANYYNSDRLYVRCVKN